jgi:hypothetical protein
MEQLINLLIVGCIFCALAYGAYWLCVKFQAPKPVFWIVGLIFLIFLLYFLAGQFGGVHNFSIRR